jgi:protein TonB
MKKLFVIAFFWFSVNDLMAQELPDSLYVMEFTSVQVEAKFPGGLSGWRKYLEENLNVDLADSCLKIPKGKKSIKQTVVVSFRVDKTGKISEVKAENFKEVHPRLAAEAVRVIKNGPDWIPAEQNGRKVIYRTRQSITWVLED